MNSRSDWWSWISIAGITASIAMVTSAPSTARAQAFGDKFYYEIGGGQLSDNALAGWNELTIDLDPYASTNYSCGDFDLDESLKSLIREISDVPDQFETYLEVAAIDLLYGLIALSIQKASPGLYEYLTNAFIRHQEYLQLKLASCHRLESQIGNGEISKLADFAKLIEWRKSAEAGQSIQEAEAEVDGTEGIPWVGGEYHGGENQPPIKLVEHGIRKGYENIVGSGGTSNGEDSPIALYFPDAPSATDWGVAVFGDKLITFVGDNQSVTGSGLQAQITKTTEEVKEILLRAVENPPGVSAEDLNRISSPNYRITTEALAAIQARDKEQQAILVNRLASEIATLQEVEKAFIIREFLVSALDDPHIYYTTIKDEYFVGLIDEIDDHIQVARDRAKVRQEFVGGLLIKTFETRDELEDQPSNLPGVLIPKESAPGAGIIPSS